MRSTRLEIDLNKFKSNIERIKKHCPNKEIMPVIKANAYGTYINKRIDVLNDFNIVAVALVDEGINLRKLGYNKKIFILNQPSFDEIDEIISNDLIIGISNLNFINKCIKNKLKINAHLEIETGMNRTGIKINNLEKTVKKIMDSNINISGIYTHLSSADYNKEYTKKQLDTFEQAIKVVKKYQKEIKYIHASASNGILNYNLNYTNLIRPGIIMYGYNSFDKCNKIIEIEPIATLKTKITHLKECNIGEKIGYSGKYTCSKKTIVATIPIGYADGLRRELSNKGYVLINNKKCPIIGNICMDSCMIDVSKIENVKIDDEVVIFDNKNITLDEIATMCDTINYEIISTMSDRIPRIFINN